MKFIHAHQIAKNTMRYDRTPCPTWSVADQVVQVLRRLRDGDHEDEVEQQLERRRHAMGLGRVAGGHAAKADPGEHVGHATMMVPARSMRRIMHRPCIGFVPLRRGRRSSTSSPSRSAPTRSRRRRSCCSCRCSPSRCSGAAAARGWGTTYALLFTAIALSWLGDGAGTFFPSRPTVPMMLLFFGLAHLCYIWLFWRLLAVRRVPAVGARLRPVVGRPAARSSGRTSAGSLIAVALYGLVLGGTAVAASRCHPLIAIGRRVLPRLRHDPGVRLFMPDATPDVDEPAHHAHLLPRAGTDRGGRRSSPTGCRARPRSRRVGGSAAP